MKLYVTRHGKTDWNEQRRICGATDIDLNAEGQAQARALSPLLQEKGVDVVITSPLRRAVHTARLAAGPLGLPVLQDARLTERSFGEFEGCGYDEPALVASRAHFARRGKGGESILQVAARIYALLDELPERYAGKTVLLVSHGAAIRVINSYFEDLTNEQFSAFRTENCQLRQYEL